MTSTKNAAPPLEAEDLFTTGVYRPQTIAWYHRVLKKLWQWVRHLRTPRHKEIGVGDPITPQELEAFEGLELKSKRHVLARARQNAARTDTSTLASDIRGIGRTVATLAVGAGLVSWVTSQFAAPESSGGSGPSIAEWVLIGSGTLLTAIMASILLVMQSDVWRRQKAEIRVMEYERLVAEHVERARPVAQ